MRFVDYTSRLYDIHIIKYETDFDIDYIARNIKRSKKFSLSGMPLLNLKIIYTNDSSNKRNNKKPKSLSLLRKLVLADMVHNIKASITILPSGEMIIIRHNNEDSIDNILLKLTELFEKINVKLEKPQLILKEFIVGLKFYMHIDLYSLCLFLENC